MALRYIHKSWKGFWNVILALLLIVIVLLGGTFLLLQLDATKDIIAEKIENDFNNSHDVRLRIGKLDGLLPFNAELSNISLTAPATEAVAADTLVSVKKANVGVDLWALLQQRLSIIALSVENPKVRLLADGNGSYSLMNVFSTERDSSSSSSWITQTEITAPNVQVNSGSLFIERLYSLPEGIALPEPVRIDQISTSIFVELSALERFVDLNSFTAQVEGIRPGEIHLSGQVYNNEESLEFNAFHFQAGRSHLQLNGTVAGVDLYKSELQQQFRNARYDVRLSSNQLVLSELRDVLTKLPDVEEPLDFTFVTDGQLNDLQLDNFSLGAGESYFSINGSVENLFNIDQLSYQFNIDTLALRNDDLEALMGDLTESQSTALENLRLNGQARGSRDSLIVDVSGSSSLGSFTLDGRGKLTAPYTYRGALTGTGIDIGPIVGGAIDTTRLNFTADVRGRNTSLRSGTMNFSASATNSLINKLAIDSLRLNSSLSNGVLDANYRYRYNDETISGETSINFNQQDPSITLQGTTQQVNIRSLFANAALDSTSLNMMYEVDWQGLKPDRMQGTARFVVEESVVGRDSVRAHELSVSLDSPDLANRTLQVNSSLFDMEVMGNLTPSNIARQVSYWRGYFRERIAQEILLDSNQARPQVNRGTVDSLSINGRIQAKDLSLLQQYLPNFPRITTQSVIQFDVMADATDLEFSSDITSDTLAINSIQISGAQSNLKGSFRHNQLLKEYSRLTFSSNADEFHTNTFEMDSLGVQMNYRQDSLYYEQEVGRFSKDARFNFVMHSSLSDTNITVAVDEFFLGNSSYAWQNVGTPTFTYNRAKAIIFDAFRFENEQEFFAVQGTLSPDQSDSLRYVLRDINLGRISDLITGQIRFAGRLNGTLQTRSLTRTPSIQGNLSVNRFKLQDRLIGDVRFKSDFNEEAERFDTRLEIITDSTKYGDYLEANDSIGQNIVLDGYVIPSELEQEQDTTFYFDADFEEIDMWAVQLLISNIFNELEGSASGSGKVWGNLQDINFKGDLQVDDVYAQPSFLETDYHLNGHVGLDSQTGVILDNLSIRDDNGGTGSLSGTVDLNDFEPITYIDLQMKLNDLRFLDNSYDPDVPFFGSLSGTGTVRLTGSNIDMQLQSVGAIRVSENSTLSIPLLEETELNQSNSFIQFVDSFERIGQKDVNLSGDELEDARVRDEVLRNALQNLTFNERFGLDLQFNAPDPISVRLIFDPVTGEILRARGTGRLRITMNDGDVQMFGSYAVSGGSYQFVGGEIFSRQLEILPGGEITWEGPPNNARLNIEALYRARSSTDFIAGGSGNAGNSGGANRIPIDLIVEITGTVSSVENDYYFRLPSSFDLNSNATVEYLLNQINRDEQQKLLQATSLLLTGNLLPVQGGGSSGAGGLGGNVNTQNALVNPLLSNQVISPLLSNQINALLNSDTSELDVDFNLNQFSEGSYFVDLGIALRLYNDKLILRREGYLTGGNSQGLGNRIGDLNVTYRINQNLSVTAFHRQDQTLTSLTGGPSRATEFTPTVDGAGVEARVQFNTWQGLVHKTQNFFRRLFGLKEINFQEAAEAENDATPPPATAQE